MSRMQIMKSKLNTMLDSEAIQKKYYDSKSRPNIKNEKIFRPDVLQQQEEIIKEDDLKKDMQ